MKSADPCISDLRRLDERNTQRLDKVRTHAFLEPFGNVIEILPPTCNCCPKIYDVQVHWVVSLPLLSTLHSLGEDSRRLYDNPVRCVSVSAVRLVHR